MASQNGNDLAASLRKLNVNKEKELKMKYTSELIGYKKVSDDKQL
jgi:hypothetical protein